MKKVTIQDIAREMGLSRNTVAKAFHQGAVANETKNAIIKKAWEMGYAKLDESLLAEVQKKTSKIMCGTILVLIGHTQSLFWSRMLEGISDGVKEYGYRMLLHVVKEEDEEAQETRALLAPDVKGILFLSVFPIRFVKGLSSSKLPMTFFNTPVNAQEYITLGDVYSLESFYAMRTITSYLIEEKKCSRFAFIGYAEGSRGVQARYLGFLSACNQFHIEVDAGYVFTNPQNQGQFSYALLESIVGHMEEIPDAIICENDEIAMDVATVLLQKNPEYARKTMISGFEGLIPSDFFKKDMLTVTVKIEEAGKRLVESIVQKIENPQRDIAFVTLMTYPKLPEAF